MLLFAATIGFCQGGTTDCSGGRAWRRRASFLLPPINLDVTKLFPIEWPRNERFTVTKEPAELEVFLVCVDSDKGSLVKVHICTYKFEYRSKNAPEFNMPLGTPIPVAGFTASEIAEDIFSNFPYGDDGDKVVRDGIGISVSGRRVLL